MMFRFALWLSPGRGEEKTLQGTMAQRLTSAELPCRTASRQARKDCAKQQFYAVFVFCCKKQGVATAGCVPIATRGCIATAGCVSVATRGCFATVGWVRLQPVDALQPPVCSRCNRGMHYNRGMCSAHSVKKKGWSNHPFSFSTSVFAPANAVMCAGLHPVTQPPDAPRRAVSPGRNPRSRVQGVPARFNEGDGVLRGFRGRNRNLPLIP